MKFKYPLVWLITLVMLGNFGLNLFVLYNLGRIYTINNDFRTDTLSSSVQNKIEADNIKLPPVKIIKFLSAYAYAKDYVIFTGKDLLVFINLGVTSDLSDGELKALIAHEIGHYVLGHLSGKPRMFSGIEEGDWRQEIDADSFAAKYEGTKVIFAAVDKSVWDIDERNIRLNALNNH